MQGNPLDWVTGGALDPALVRRLEGSGRLERRHIFPPSVFASLGKETKLGLNGILLAKGTPPLPKCDPGDLLRKTRALREDDTADLDELEMRRRTGSHLVAWNELTRSGTPAHRYSFLLKERAAKVAQEARDLASY